MSSETKKNTAPKSWQEKRLRRLMLISPSQCETFDLCKRKWWLNKVRGLPTPSTGSQVFGTVLHSVCERFLLADDLGRDAAGNPVNLYPDKWWVAKARFDEPSEGEIGLLEQDQVKTLIAAAIEGGVLERQPGRQVEVQFRRDVIQLPCPECGPGGNAGPDVLEGESKCETCGDDGKGCHIQVTGIIDLLLPEGVTDHKTTSNMKWAKSPAKLKENIQMLIYGCELMHRLTQQKDPAEMPKHITLRHNVFCKDKQRPQVRKVETTVTIKDLLKFWEGRLVPMAVEMEKYRRIADQWHEIPEPATASAACNSYGGCPFRSICGGQESELGYEQRMSRAVVSESQKAGGPSAPLTKPFEGGTTMGAFAARLAEKAAAMKAAKDGAQAAAPPINPTPAPVAAAAPVAAPPPADAPATDAPPWALPGCPACKGAGFNSQGNPCRICDAKGAAAGNPTSTQFTIEALGNGRVKWTYKDDPTLVGESPLAIQGTPATVQTTERSTPPAAAPPKATRKPRAAATEAAPAPAVAQEPAPASETAQEPDAEPVPTATETVATPTEVRGPVGRPRKGFILLINCQPTTGASNKPNSGRFVYRLNEVLARVGNQMAIDNKAASFYDLDAFARRDALSAYAPKLAEEFAADIVVASMVGTGQSDLKVLLEAIRPFAGMEVIGESL